MSERKTLDRDEVLELVRARPEYQEGRLTEEEAEEVADYLYTHQEEIVEEELKAEIRRTLMKMIARGQVEYDPETGVYRAIKEE